MSHTLALTTATFNYNSDLSGNVTITTREGRIDVPGCELVAFVAEYVRGQRINALESATTRELLGLPK